MTSRHVQSTEGWLLYYYHCERRVPYGVLYVNAQELRTRSDTPIL